MDAGVWREQDAEATTFVPDKSESGSLPRPVSKTHLHPVGAATNMSYYFARITPFPQGFFASQNRHVLIGYSLRLLFACTDAGVPSEQDAETAASLTA